MIKDSLAVLGCAIIAALSGCASVEHAYVSNEVNRLCETQANVEIFETVVRPAEEFHTSGEIKRTPPGYEIKFKEEVLYSGPRQATVKKIYVELFRNSDSVLVARDIHFIGYGGELGHSELAQTGCAKRSKSVSNAFIKQ